MIAPMDDALRQFAREVIETEAQAVRASAELAREDNEPQLTKVKDAEFEIVE